MSEGRAKTFCKILKGLGSKRLIKFPFENLPLTSSKLIYGDLLSLTVTERKKFDGPAPKLMKTYKSHINL